MSSSAGRTVASLQVVEHQEPEVPGSGHRQQPRAGRGAHAAQALHRRSARPTSAGKAEIAKPMTPERPLRGRGVAVMAG